jgi:hydrogenase/urease accessory protein HupE
MGNSRRVWRAHRAAMIPDVPARPAGGRELALIALAAIGLWLSAPGSAGAHDLERTRVTLTFAADGSFTLDLANDPEWLLLRLEPFLDDYPDLGRRDAVERVTPAARDRRLAELASVMADRIVLFVDGREVRASSVTYHAPPTALEPDGTPTPGRYRLEGRVGPDARLLRWFYGIVADPYPLSIARADGQMYTEWIGGTVWSRPIDLTGQFVQPTRWATARDYVALGFTHILPKGLDHILFVLGLFLLATRVRPVLWQVTAFTVAHSITLGLSIYGVVSLPPTVVEPLIALSIAYVAIENVITRELHTWRVVVVFLFGLLHGLGFAGVLRELSLPRDEFLTALVSFNVGVELGQLTVIGAAALLLWPAMRQSWYRRQIVVPASVAIALVGAYWTVTRAIVR